MSFFKGIYSCLVALMAQKAEVKYDPLRIMPNQIASKISSLGFQATVLETEFLGNGVVELKVCLDHMLFLGGGG